jgi:hypothetical protein
MLSAGPLIAIALLACSTSSPAPHDRVGTGSSSAPAPSQPAALACTRDGDCTAACAGADGACICFEGACALHPNSPRISVGRCEHTRDCGVEPASGRCEPGLPTDARVHYAGPICACDERDHRCHLQWFDPVACRSDADCWIDDTPVPHAIARPPRLRGRTFRGCVDGERAPACGEGHCTLRALTC